MGALSNCAGCDGVLRGEVRFGLCPACLLESLSSQTGVFAPESRTLETDELRQNFWVGARRFHLVKSLGVGGMGQVWLAEDSRLDRKQVALKFVSERWGRNPALINELRQELIRTRDLQHERIVKVHDWHEHGDEPPFISMEYVPGRPLSAVLAEHPDGLAYARLHPLLVYVCQALIHAHQRGLLHRDIKPGNILTYSSKDRELAKLTDFGIGRFLETQEAAPGQALGTKAYMSPAHARGEPAAISDDVFALGATMYQLLTGKLPYGLQGCLQHELIPMAEAFGEEHRCNAVPLPVRTMIWSCLQMEATARPESVAKILAVLAQHPPIEQLVLPAPPPEPIWRPIEPERVPSQTLRNVMFSIFAILLGVLYYERDMVINYFQPPEIITVKERLPLLPPSPSTNSSALFLKIYPTNATPHLSLIGKTNFTYRASLGYAWLAALPAGSNIVRATLDGYSPTNISVTLKSGETATNTLTLSRLYGALTFSVPQGDWSDRKPFYRLHNLSEPSLANSNKMTNWKVTLPRQPTGLYDLSIYWPGESVITRRVELVKNKSVSVSFTFAWISVNVTNVNAKGNMVPATLTWTENGMLRTANTPAVIRMREGERDIAIKAFGHDEMFTSINLVTYRRLTITNLTIALEHSPHPLPKEPFTNNLGMAFPLPRPKQHRLHPCLDGSHGGYHLAIQGFRPGNGQIV